MIREVHVITDLLWGSCAKRLFTEYYANEWEPDVIVSNGMPNSGGYDSKGLKWSCLPIGYPCKLMISPGSVINLEDLRGELEQLPVGAKVFIHEHAGVVASEHLEYDAKRISIGSTMTGGAEVVKDKMDRNPDTLCQPIAKHFADEIGAMSTDCQVVTTKEWLYLMSDAERILALTAQGHGLSINWGLYPYTTSRNTSPAQTIADAGLPPQLVTRVIGCCRPYPIRVSNRYDEVGNMIGYSGPGFEGQTELEWDHIGVPAEITSVSKKVRRVFSWSDEQLFQAVEITGCTDIFMGFINYIPKEKQLGFINHVDSRLCKVSYIGYDKTTDDIVRTEDYTWDKSWV